MKRLGSLFLVYSLICSAGQDMQDFQLIIEPVWKDLEKNDRQRKLFGSKWVLVGSITFKKKSKEAVNLNRLYLRWKGSVLPHLMGSLYRKMPDRDFLPIEEHLVCDGTWNKAQQTLRLTFDHKESLGLTNVFYLVLTVPSDLELAVRRGRFDLEPQVLPEQFRTATSHQNLSLTLDALDATID